MWLFNSANIVTSRGHSKGRLEHVLYAYGIRALASLKTPDDSAVVQDLLWMVAQQ